MNASVPALTPPPGLESNFKNPQNRCYLTVIPCAAIVGITIILVFTRMYTKAYILRSVGWDDYTCMFAALSSVVFLGFLMALYQLGFGVHQWDISYTSLESLMSKEGKTLSALWGPTMFFTKLSLLLLYYRIFAPNRVTKYLVVIGILYCFVLYTSYLLLTFLLCQSPLIPYCKYELNLLFITTSALNLLGDIYLLLIPLAAVAKLQMPLRQKLGVSAVFLAGVLACAAAAFATYYRILLLHTRDITWNFTPIFILSVTEINTGIIVSCMPTMPALIHDIRSDVSVSRKPSQTCSSRVGGESRSQSRSQHHHHPSKASAASKSCIHTANSSRDTQRQVRFDIPRGQSPVELDSTPVQMEEALMRTTPRSHFSDDSSVRGSVVHQPGEYWWLT